MMQILVSLAYGAGAFVIILGTVIVVASKFAANATEANTTLQYLITQLGQTGLAGWFPVVIALSVGVAFISYFAFGGKGKSYR